MVLDGNVIVTEAYQNFYGISSAFFGSTSIVGLCLTLICLMYVCVSDLDDRTSTFCLCILISHAVSIASYVPVHGILENPPADLTDASCKISTFFREWGMGTVDLVFMFLILDRVYSKCFPDGTKTVTRRAVVFSCAVSCTVAGVVAVPTTLETASVSRVGAIPPNCATPLSQSVMELTLKLCFVTIVPAVIVASSVMEALFSNAGNVLYPLCRRAFAFYATMFCIEMPHVIVRVIQAVERGPNGSDGVAYAEAFTRSMATLRFLAIPVFVFVLSSYAPVDDLNETIDKVWARCSTRFSKKVKCPGVSVSIPFVDEGLCCGHVSSYMEKIKCACKTLMGPSEMRKAKSTLTSNEWTYPRCTLPVNENKELCDECDAKDRSTKTASSETAPSCDPLEDRETGNNAQTRTQDALFTSV